MDSSFCNASVDLSVPGKSNTSPRNLTMTVWKQSRHATTGTFTKRVLVFTDPSGTLAPPSVPLKTWVQLQQNVVASTKTHATECIKRDKSLVFKDPREVDPKVVTFSENEVTLEPFGGANKRLSFCFKSHLSIDF